jgi:hypothetical protein
VLLLPAIDRYNEVLAAVTGQIIRSGIFQDRAFPFTLRLREWHFPFLRARR